MTTHFPGWTRPIEPRVNLVFRFDRSLIEVVNNQLLGCTLVFQPPDGAPIELRRRAPAGTAGRVVAWQPPYHPLPGSPAPATNPNPIIQSYVFDAVSPAELDRLLDAAPTQHLEVAARLEIAYLEFFRLLLQQMTSREPNTNNLARPTPAFKAAIAATFQHQRAGRRAITGFSPKQRMEILDLPCQLRGSDVVAPPGSPPVLGLNVALLLEEIPEDRRTAIKLALMAAAHTTLYELDVGHELHEDSRGVRVPPRGNPAWYQRAIAIEASLVNFLGTHSDLERGQRILDEPAQAALAALEGRRPPPDPRDSRDSRERPNEAHLPLALQVVRVVRNSIDERLITANHWGEDREDWNDEPYQRMLSDVFGNLRARNGFSSPVSLLRGTFAVAGRAALPLHGQARLIMQYGVGHCEEHATVSYEVMSHLLNQEGPARAGARALFHNVVKSGYYGTDHAFVVGGFHVSTTYAVANGPDVFDLGLALATSNTGDGFVLDPYLDPHFDLTRRQGQDLDRPANLRPRTAQALLDYMLTRPPVAGRDVSSPYLIFEVQTPDPQPTDAGVPLPARTRNPRPW